jgi:zinc/manganese transport system permease protein
MISFIEFDLLRQALIAGTFAAILSGVVGYFMVLRRLAFAGHALGHIGFAGATGAGLLHITPFSGQLGLTLLAAMGMGALGHRINKSDIAIGIVLALALGLGVLFLHFYTHYAAQAMSVLFGNLLGVSKQAFHHMLWMGGGSLILMSFIARPLFFASLEPELAEAKGVRIPLVNTLFLISVAIAVSVVSQVIGVLLVFTLLIGPAAAALNWTRSLLSGLFMTVLLSLCIVWMGILVAFMTDWPIPFWISFLVAMIYFLSLWTKLKSE